MVWWWWWWEGADEVHVQVLAMYRYLRCTLFFFMPADVPSSLLGVGSGCQTGTYRTG